jgi:hypothetical protein
MAQPHLNLQFFFALRNDLKSFLPQRTQRKALSKSKDLHRRERRSHRERLYILQSPKNKPTTEARRTQRKALKDKTISPQRRRGRREKTLLSKNRKSITP